MCKLSCRVFLVVVAIFKAASESFTVFNLMWIKECRNSSLREVVLIKLLKTNGVSEE